MVIALHFCFYAKHNIRAGSTMVLGGNTMVHVQKHVFQCFFYKCHLPTNTLAKSSWQKCGNVHYNLGNDLSLVIMSERLIHPVALL